MGNAMGKGSKLGRTTVACYMLAKNRKKKEKRPLAEHLFGKGVCNMWDYCKKR